MIMENCELSLRIEAVDTGYGNRQPERTVVNQLERPAWLASDFPDKIAKNVKCVFSHASSTALEAMFAKSDSRQ